MYRVDEERRLNISRNQRGEERETNLRNVSTGSTISPTESPGAGGEGPTALSHQVKIFKILRLIKVMGVTVRMSDCCKLK